MTRRIALAALCLTILPACDQSTDPGNRGTVTEASTRYYSQGTRIYLERVVDRDTVRVGLESRWGAGIIELSLNGLNVVNAYDPGREIQLSLYDGAHHYDSCAACTGKWGWNPVQAGDRHGNGSILLDKRLGPDGLYVKIQPIHWSPESNGGWFGHAAPADIEIEQWIVPVEEHPRTLRLTYRITHLGEDRHGFTEQQEFPAVYVNREFHRFIHYTGGSPWAGGPVTIDWLPQLFIEPQRLSYTAEWWGAFVDDRNLGLTLFTPGSYPYMRGGVQPGTTGTRGSGAVYTHPFTPFGLGPKQVVEGDVYLLLGDYRDSRKTIYELQKSIEVRDVAAPMIAVDSLSPTNAADGSVEIRGWAFDNVGISRIDVLHEDSVIGTAQLGQLSTEIRRQWVGAPSNAGFRVRLSAHQLPAGVGSIVLRAHDPAGHATEVEVAVERR